MYKGEDKEYICYPFKNGIMFTAGSVDGQHTAGSVDRWSVNSQEEEEVYLLHYVL